MINKYTQWVTLFLSLFFLQNNEAFGQLNEIPNGYYDDASGLSGNELKTTLHNIIDGHTEKSYSDCWNILRESDEDPNNSSNFILIYTGRSIPKSSSYPDWNREHVWAKSHGDFGTSPPAGTDAHHLRPCDVSVNSARGSKDFDNGGTQHEEATECYTTNTTWEPRDAVKGDVARMMFYMVVRYEGDVSGEPDLELVDYVTGSTSSPIFGVLSTLLEWHNNDPVDDFERHRNEVVYSYQNNRNPFIDHPEYVAKIWGGSSGTLISNIQINPLNPGTADNVSVSAEITDEDEIESAALKWGLSSNNLSNEITMNNSSGDTFETSTNIPSQTEGTIVFFKVSATNTNSDIVESETQQYTVSDEIEPIEVVLLDEDFESTTVDADINISDWTNYAETGTRKWLSKLYNSNKYAQSTSHGSGEQNTVWLITPSINLDNTKNETFSFDVNVGYWKHQGLTIYISSNFNGTDVNLATWTDVTTNFTIPTEPNNAYGTISDAGTMDLSSYNGTIYIAFKYSGDESGTESKTTTYQIDNVLVKGEENTLDEVPPTLTISPKNGSTSIKIDTVIIFESNEPLFKPDGSEITTDYIQSSITITEQPSGNQTQYSSSINNSKTVITLTPNTTLNYNTNYSSSVETGAFADSSLNTTASYSSLFTTILDSDLFAPVLSFTPADGTVNFNIESQILITSTEKLLLANGEPINETYLTSVISLNTNDQNGTPVSISANISSDAKQIIIAPQEFLNYNTNYWLIVNEYAFEDSASNKTEAYTIGFTTAAKLDNTAPEFTIMPPNEANQVEINSNIIILSNEELKTNMAQNIDETYLKSEITLSIDSENGTSLAYSATVSDNNKTITINPDIDFTFESQYYISINSEAFEDTAGNKTAKTVSSFSTKPQLDNSAPEFMSNYPAVNNIEINSFELAISLNEGGRVFYLTQPKNLTPPTKSDVLSADTIQIDQPYNEFTIEVNELEAFTGYSAYMLTQDNLDEPNTSAFLFKLNITTLGESPAITAQPESTTICENSTAYFVANINGTSPFVYSWFKNNIPIKNSDNDTLIITSIIIADTGSYNYSVSNTWGKVVSESAKLNIYQNKYAGADSAIITQDTVTIINLNNLVSGNTAVGEWIDVDNSGALNKNLFNPKIAGIGNFNFYHIIENECVDDTATINVTVEETIGINSFDQNRVSIFPNPGNGYFTIMGISNTAPLKYRVYAIDGKLIFTGKSKNIDNLTNIDLQHLQKGIYFLNLETASKKYIKRVIIN